MYYPDRDPYYPDRAPYNKQGVNRGYDDGYPGEPRGRDNAFRRSSRRMEDRRAFARRPTHVPYVQDDGYKTWPDKDNVFNGDMREPRDEFSKSCSGGAEVGKGKVIFIVAFCLLLFLVLGAMAIGGVALYYAHFETAIDTYGLNMKCQEKGLSTGMVLHSSDSFKKQETKFCKGVKAVFGGELKTCEVDFLYVDSNDEVDLYGRLHFYRNKLETAADEVSSNSKFVKERLTYASYTQFICSDVIGGLLPTRELSIFTSNFSTATPMIEQRNNTKYYEVQKSVCDAIKSALGSVYINCYVTSFVEDEGIRVIVDVNLLIDEFKKDPGMDNGSFAAFQDEFKNGANSTTMPDKLKEKMIYAAVRSKLAKLINKGGVKLAFITDFVLKVE